MTEAYAYDLPEASIAQRPSTPRDASRLLALRGARIDHLTFRDLPSLMRSGDVLVLNETRVIASRLHGTRAGGGRAEVLLLRPARAERYDPNAPAWHALVKPGRQLRAGAIVRFGDFGEAEVTGVHADGVREIELRLRVPLEEFLERAGRLPLPPYIHNESDEAQERYQTIFAREPGSVAAPTASLHFTQRVFDDLRSNGVEIVNLVLDVGLGTFRPIQSDRIDEHFMHDETFSIPAETAGAIAAARSQGRRVVAAGTTVMRALEGSAAKHGEVRAGNDRTDIFITPGFQFRTVDALITNFHLPRSTLLVLVCAFAGRDPVFRAYREAIDRGYRFFSFGDAMFVEPEATA